MTLSEFKAWFEGFSEGIDAAPTADQFAKIKAKVAKIDGTVTTYPVFVDLWWPRHYDYRDYSRQFWTSGNIAYAGAGNASPQAMNALYAPASKGDNQTVVAFDAQEAFRSLGRAEAA